MKKKIEELFRLAMKAQEKTSAYVSFETSNHGWGCVVIIMDDGFETGREYDGYYPMDMFYPEDIKNAVEEFCDYWGIPKGIAGGLNDNPDIICKIASLYEKNQDTNVASADTMKEAVKQVLKKEGVWK